MSKILLTGTFTMLACASIVAQATQAPQGQAPQAQSAAAQSAAPKADTLVIQGCIERSPQASSATPGATGTAGSASDAFILSKAMKPTGTSGSAGASPSVASSYRLDADASKLTPHVGHKVELTGTVEAASAAPSSGASAMSRFKVDNVKMIAASCTQ